MRGCSYSVAVTVPVQRRPSSLVRSILAAQVVALSTMVMMTIAFIGGCETAERKNPGPLPVEVIEEPSSRIPHKAFASLPQVQSMALSPSGTSLAFLQNIEDHTYLVTTTHDGKARRKLFESDNKKFSIWWFDWVNDERLIIGVVVADVTYGLEGPFRWTQTRRRSIMPTRYAPRS